MDPADAASHAEASQSSASSASSASRGASPFAATLASRFNRDARPPGEPLFELRGVSKSFGPLQVLRDLNLTIYRNQTTVIVGPSGTGKSVLLKLLVRLLSPDHGAVFFDGRQIDRLNNRELVAVRKRIGFLFQMGALFDSLSVGRNIAFPLVEHTRMSASEREARVERVLRLVGLDGTDRKMPGQLSGGQRKRVALARSIALEPEAVLYDEPTTGLDPVTSDLINELILAMGEKLGLTNIVVTHDMVSAGKIADRVIMLSKAAVVADGPPRAFFETDLDLVQRFIHGQAESEDQARIRQAFEQTATRSAGAGNGSPI